MTEPGWYDNPGGEGLRYWDGNTWTEHVTQIPGIGTSRTRTGLAAIISGFFIAQVVAAVVGITAVVIVAQLTGVLNLETVSDDMLDDAPLLTVLTVGSSLGMWATFALTSRFVSRRYRTKRFLQDLGFVGFRWSDIPLGAGVAIAGRIYTIVVAVAADVLFGPFDSEGQLPVDLAEQTGWVFIAFALVVAVGAPVFEELYFRGLLQRSLLERYRPSVALLVTAAAFAVVHITISDFAFSVLTIVSIFPVGLALGLLAYHRRNIIAAILAHFVFNASAVALIAAGAS